MTLYYIKAKVSVYVRGISGASQEGISRLLDAPNIRVAKQIFEAYCQDHFAKMEFEKLSFEYLEIAEKIN
jgi:hypothetical protein